MTRLHATCVAIEGRGVLLTGPPGAGKSDLALRLIDRGAKLVADDGTELRAAGGRLLASAPATIAGLIEIRGIGVVEQPALAGAPVALLVALGEEVPRMPEETLPHLLLEGVAVPRIALSAHEGSAPIKVEQALRRWGLHA